MEGNFDSEVLRAMRADDAGAIGEAVRGGRLHRDDRDDDGRTALHLASAAGSPAVVSELLAHGADIHARDAFDQTPLLEAAGAKRPSTRVIAQLLAAGADADAGAARMSARMVAFRQGGEVHRLFARHWPEVTGDPRRVGDQLIGAVFTGDDERLCELAGAADVRAVRTDYFTLLGVAINEDHPRCVAVLLALGCDPNQPEPCGALPLCLAVDVEADSFRQAGVPVDLRLVGPLLASGADPARSDAGGTTPRMMAHWSAIQMLITALGR